MSGQGQRTASGKLSGMPRISPQTKTGAVTEVLRKQILAGELRPGEPLQQELVASLLGVSPTPVREAFALLEAEGFLQRQPHRGVVVAQAQPIDPRERELNLDVRRVLERRAIDRLLAGDAPELLDRLAADVARAEEVARTGDVPALRAAANEFHRTLAVALDSDLHAGFLHQIATRSLFYAYGRSMKHLDLSFRAHAELVRALVDRDRRAAHAVWTRHLRAPTAT